MGTVKNIHHKMKNSITIVLVVLATLAMGEQMEDIQDIVREMVAVEMRGSNAKIAMLEQEMKTRDDEMKDMNETIATLGKELAAKDATFGKELKTRDDTIDTFAKKMKDMNDTIDTLGKELTAKDATFEKELKTKDATIDKLVREVSFLKDPPYTFFCAYRGGTSIYSGTIKYD